MFLLSSCSDEEYTDTRITYYPVLTITGDEFVQVPIGSEYNDAGCTAKLMGEDYSSHVVVEGLEDIDVNKAGLYYVTYYATNPDGYTRSTTRTVAVCDPNITTDISGTYTVQSGSYRLYNGKQTAYSGYTVTFTYAAPGIFEVSDWMAGWYDQRAGYGSSYAMKGYAQLLEDNTIQILSGDVAGWGDSYESFENGAYDPETNTLTWDVTYTDYGFVFHVIATNE